MNTQPSDINTPTKEREVRRLPVLPQRFPAIPQLIVLGVILFLLLGSAGVSYLISKSNSAGNAWIDAEMANKSQPSASLTTTTIKQLEAIEIEAKAGFVYDAINNRVLYQKEADQVLPIASITKLMTSLVAHELLSEDTAVTVPLTATLLESASGLQTGERLTARSLINYAMLSSSNDAAHSLAAAAASAISAGSSEAVFVEAMNIRAKELGLQTLSFKNPHGLDIDTQRAGAYGSARDISFLMEYIYKNYPDLLSVTMEDSTRIYNTDGDFREATNTNRALLDIPQLRGSKTGYTILAGGNLTVVFEAGLNRPIIITVLGSSFSGRFSDVLSLIEATQASLIESSQ
ncbi:MAG: D-alanyl-D-alanine carboxypeptidase family protein [Candidatus Paceibacteria bacterium]